QRAGPQRHGVSVHALLRGGDFGLSVWIRGRYRGLSRLAASEGGAWRSQQTVQRFFTQLRQEEGRAGSEGSRRGGWAFQQAGEGNRAAGCRIAGCGGIRGGAEAADRPAAPAR